MRKPLLFIVMFFLTIDIFAQYRMERYDTSYYMSYRNKLILGAMAEKKNAVFKTSSSGADRALRFRPNSPGRLGISAEHDFINISAAFGVNSLDPSYAGSKGKTRQTNLQMSFTGIKLLADIYFQKYKGLYLNTDAIASSGNKYYVRPDIQTELYGTTVTLIGNSRKFSAQAAFLLDAWQKKSAGSLLYGGELFYGSVKGDSTFIPSALAAAYPHAKVSKINFTTFGPGLGYGYTLVLNKHFFVTGMASLNADVSYIKERNEDNSQNSSWKFNPNLKAKGAIGYNTENWGIGLSYVSNRLFFTGIDRDSRYLNYNDNYKLMYIRRINPGKTIPKITGFAGRVINAIGLGFLIN